MTHPPLMWRVRQGLALLRGLLLLGRGGGRARLRPLANLVGEGAQWTAQSSDPQFLLDFEGGVPRGLCRIDLRLDQDLPLQRPRLYIDRGNGYSELDSRCWTLRRGMRLQVDLYIPLRARRLRLDPAEQPGAFRIEAPEIRPLGLSSTLRFLYRERFRPALRGPRLGSADDAQAYAELIRLDEPVLEDVRAEIDAHQASLRLRPRFSILMPTYNSDLRYLDRAIASVRAQTWTDWELCIADDASPQTAVRQRLREWALREPRIRLVECERNGGISAASNRALELAGGDFVGYLDHDDELAPLALYHVAVALNERPDLDLIYTDEDKITPEGHRFQPHFKPGWNPELLYSQNYVSHFAVYRRRVVQELGGLRSACDGSQDHDLVLRVAARTSADRIHHVPVVLYHWRAIPGSTALARSEKSYPHEAGLRALRDRFAGEAGVTVESGRLPFTYRVSFPLPDPPPRVSIIVPTRDGYAHAHRCLDSLFARTAYPDFEVLVVDNQSRDPRTLEWLDQCRLRPNVRVLPFDAPFNYSRINNHAARAAQGEVLVLLNDDTEVISPDWLSEMVSLALRADVGAVGAKLYYPDDSIQHAGVALGIGGVAGHVHYHFPRSAHGYMGRLHLRQAMSAVTAACLAVTREKYFAVGGLDEEQLTVAFNDVDFCLKLAARGWRAVWTPFAELYHYESKSRGPEDNEAKRARFRGEIEVMQQRWPALIEDDPYYHRCWSRSAQDYSFEPLPRMHWPWAVRDRAEPAKEASA